MCLLLFLMGGKDYDEGREKSGFTDNSYWAKKVIGDMNLAFADINEHGIEVFEETFLQNPEGVINELPDQIDKILNCGGGIFKGGHGAGGPYPPALIPIWNAVGTAYPYMTQDGRETCLLYTSDAADDH